MSSIPKINSIGRVKFAKFQANDPSSNPIPTTTKEYGYDSFTPSFRSGKTSAMTKVAGTALAALMAATGTVTLPACQKEQQPIINTVNVDVNIDLNFDDILAALQQNNQYLQQLVQQNEELKAIMLRIEKAVLAGNNLSQEQKALLMQILGAVLAINTNNPNNLGAILALLEKMLDQLEQMNNQQATNYAAIIAALNNMSEQLQNQLIEILNAIGNLDEHMQEGYTAILAQLNGMSTQLQNGLLAVLSHIDHFSAAVQAKLNALIALATQMNATMVACTAQIMAQLQNMQEEQQLQALSILEAMNNMSTQQQQQFAGLMGFLHMFAGQSQMNFLAVMHQLTQMEGAQQQQYLSILNVLQQQGSGSGLTEEIRDLLVQILAQMQNMQSAQEQQYLNVMSQLQNMQQAAHADFIEFMAKLTNLENGQQAILNAMEGMNAEFLAKFTQALAKLDTIIGNQATQIAQLAQIYAAIQNGNAQLSDINEFLQNLDLGTGVNLDVIEGLLAEILASQNTANNLLNNMNNNIAFILTTANTLQAQMEQVTNNQAVLLDWQEAIWNKIPVAMNNCNCEECCAQIIVILQQISEQIENLDWNHEGIDDDLDPLLGKARQLLNMWSSALDDIIKNGDSDKAQQILKDAQQLLDQLSARSAKKSVNK